MDEPRETRRWLGCRDTRKGLAMTLLLFTFSSGCVIVDQDPYPENWSPILIDAGECPDIAGTYENAGRGNDSVQFCAECGDRPDLNQCYSNCIYSPVRHLSTIFFNTALPGDDSISLEQPGEGILQVHFDGLNPIYQSRTLSLDDRDYQCEDGMIWVQIRTTMDTDFGAVIVVSRKVGLGKAEDGSLVGEYREKDRGVVFIGIPAYGSERKYIRWLAVQNESR